MGSCDPSSDRNTVYLTFYTGYGFGNYRLQHSGFSNVFNDKLSQFDFGASLHLKLNRSNIGFGADYNLFKNDFKELLIEDNRTLLYNLYLSYEYNLYSSHFFDFGFFVGAGYPIAAEIFQENKLKYFPLSLNTGLFSNFILNSYSSIIVRVKYNVFIGENNLSPFDLEHQLSAIQAEVGFRMWFNF